MSALKKKKSNKSGATKMTTDEFLNQNKLTMRSNYRLIKQKIPELLELNKSNMDKELSQGMMQEIFDNANIGSDVFNANDIDFATKFINGMTKRDKGESVLYYAICSLQKYNCNSVEIRALSMTTTMHARQYITYEFINFVSLFMMCVKFQFTRKLCFISSLLIYF